MSTGQHPKRRSWDSLSMEDRLEFATQCKGGLIAQICGEQGRWSVFTYAMAVLQQPQGSRVIYDPGLDITKQCNGMVRAARRMGADWLWIIGDDHVFDNDIIFRLLWADVDVIVPNVVQRSSPYYPVVYDGVNPENGHHKVKMDLAEHGVQEVYAAGSAGMLVRKRVIDAVPEEPFQRWGHLQNEDLEFCKNIREAGFKIHIDVDCLMGHIGTTVAWPMWHEATGAWEVNLQLGMDSTGQNAMMPIRRVTPGSASLTAA